MKKVGLLVIGIFLLLSGAMFLLIIMFLISPSTSTPGDSKLIPDAIRGVVIAVIVGIVFIGLALSSGRKNK